MKKDPYIKVFVQYKNISIHSFSWWNYYIKKINQIKINFRPDKELVKY